MGTVREKLWLWGHEAGSHDTLYKLPNPSRMTPAEGAYYLGIPNLLMVAFGGKPEPPFAQYARALSPLDQVVWSIIGDASSTRNDAQSDLDEVLALAEQFPNITGAIMDDFFHPPNADGAVSRVRVAQLEEFRTRLHAARTPLDLWVVLYRHDLILPVTDHLATCDVVTYWTWEPEELRNLEADFARAEALAPQARKVLGCYMYDYNVSQPMPVELMKHQCTLGLRWLKEGRIDGLIFLASCIADLGLETVEWTKRWIADIGDETI